ncbi:MAG: hypothetical protein Q7S22_05275 [Candidatus Micrarchaeota archaeon]|nr:hypothetical protein [Candidatus Micrarchaeota archaeon]
MTDNPNPGRAIALRLLQSPLQRRGEESGTKGFHTMLDVLTAQPAHYKCMAFFLPFPREVLEGKITLDKQEMELVKRELYSKIYQSIGSLLLAILNVEAVRRIKESVKLIEAANTAYLRNNEDMQVIYNRDFSGKNMKVSPNHAFEDAVNSARRIMAEVEVLIIKMENDPLDYETCKKIAVKCEEFREATIRARESGFASTKELLSLLPIYRLWLDGAVFNSVDEIVRAFNTNSIGQTVSTVDGFRLRGHIEHFYFNLQSSARSSQFFAPTVPSNIPGDINPIAFHISSERVPTHFAPLFALMEQNLLTHFDAIQIKGDDGRKVLVFCPSTALRNPTPANLLQ